MAELAVTDTGIGIPTEDLPLLGNRFHRVETPGGRSQEGTGIGLALAFELVRLHGGTIYVTSQIGRGTPLPLLQPLVGAEASNSEVINHSKCSSNL